MAHAHVLTPDEIREQATLGPDSRHAAARARVLGVVMLALAAGLGFLRGDEFQRFFFSYLVSFCFLLSITLGALFITAIHHTVSAKWDVVLRRVWEVIGTGMPLLAVLFLPILVPVLFGSHALFVWTDHDVVAADHLLHAKTGYLNVPFFAIRCVVYFLSWIVMGRFFLRNSRAQDETGDFALTLRMRKLAPLCIVVLGLTSTFAAFDLLMSLEPKWFSTIFGVYFFAGSMVGMFATTVLVCLLLQDRGRMKGVVTTEHYHDLGKYTFAFVFFWGYIAFSQFLLIWYADLPEETFWFGYRAQGSWRALSWFLLLGHLLVPFAGLLSRHVKRNHVSLAFWAVVLLVMHWIDMYWVSLPALHGEALDFGLVDVACFIGLTALWAGGFLARAARSGLVPVRDPYLRQSVAFTNF